MRKYRRITERLLTGLLAVLLALNVSALTVHAESKAVEADIFGTAEEYSTYNVGATLSDSFYYSDKWLTEDDPTKRNDALALLSMQMIATSVDDNPDGNAVDMLKQMGFGDFKFVGFNTENTDDAAATVAAKMVGNTKIVAVIIESYSFSSDSKKKAWKQNFTVNGTDGVETEHAVWSKAAYGLADELTELYAAEGTIYWIMGQSRGGAIANLTAKELPAKLAAKTKSNFKVFGYTFEAPAVAKADQNSSAFDYIHNYICSDDPVTKIPMWGMVRYGVDYKLNTEEIDEKLPEELTRLGSTMTEVYYSPYEGIDALVQKLEDRVSWTPEGTGANDRADYSRQKKDEFTDTNENTQSVEYNVQVAMVDLMDLIFSGAASGISAESLLENPEMLMDMLELVINGAKAEEEGNYNESCLQYYSAAQVLYLVLYYSTSGQSALTMKDIYCLLKVLAPLLVDTSYTPEPESDAMTELTMYLSPAIEIFQNINNITYSHHFDTLLARLKALAPQPELAEIAITIDEPAAGDGTAKATAKVNEFIDDLGYDWLTVEDAVWNTEEDLKDDSIYYLTISLNALAHLIPEDFSFMLNGQEPFDDPVIGYTDGIGTVTATFEFVIGTPDQCTVSFATDKGEAPEGISVIKGQSLKKVDRPEFTDTIKADGKSWVFVDWFDDDGNSWDEITPADDIVLTARWLHSIDDIRVTFEIPEFGGDMPEPTIPDDDYELFEYSISDENYETADKADSAGEYHLNLFFKVINPDKAVFATKLVDGEYYDYAGKAYVNGKKTQAFYEYEEEEGYAFVSVFFDFTVGIEPNVYSFVEGAGQEWIKGSDENACFKVTCEGDDSEIYWMFNGLKVDGEYLEDEDFSATEGSVIIELPAEYLETLGEGEHTLTAEFKDSEATTTFTVKNDVPVPPDVPGTGDSGLGSVLLLMTLSIVGCACYAIGLRRRKVQY